MSTVADFITAVRDDLKDGGTTQQFTDAQIIRYANRFRIYMAALNFRYQLSNGIKNTNCTLASGTSTYTLPSDFYAEKIVNYSDKSDALKKITLDEYIAGGHNTSTVTGTSDKYMILGDTLYVFDPVPSGGTLNFWYYYILSTLTTNTATTNTMPHGGVLDEFWREFVSKLLLNRDEYNVQYEEYLFRTLEGNILSALVGRSAPMYMIPTQDGAGIDQRQDIDAFYP